MVHSAHAPNTYGIEGWVTRQVYYTNAFAQVELQDEVFFEPPKLFAPGSGKNLVLKLIASLYGLNQAPKTFYGKLSDEILKCGSTHDSCLFMKRGMMRVIYGGDIIFAAPA
jgi:hypothetical protein